jgi:uncharacterized protein YjbJ (UPF0337 family)
LIDARRCPGGAGSGDKTMADHDRIEGAAKNIGGKVKEAAGKMTGDTKLQAEGKADQVEGKVQSRRRRQGQPARQGLISA